MLPRMRDQMQFVTLLNNSTISFETSGTDIASGFCELQKVLGC